MRTLTKQDMSDLMVGAGILGCGGGGSEQLGRQLIDTIYNSGRQFTLIDPMEIPDDAYLCIVAGVGGGVGKEIKDKLKSYLAAMEKQNRVELETHSAQRAIGELEDLIGKRFYTYVPSEIGPGNTILSMYLATLEGKPAIDADACGRAKPEMSLSTTHVAGIPISPMTMANTIGDLMILKKAADDYRGEDIARFMAVMSVLLASKPVPVSAAVLFLLLIICIFNIAVSLFTFGALFLLKDVLREVGEKLPRRRRKGEEDE